MKKCLAVVGDGFNTIRTGRANPAILDKITVSAACSGVCGVTMIQAVRGRVQAVY